MTEIFCPDCGAFVETVYEDELPLEFECVSCSAVFTESGNDEDDRDYYYGEQY